MTLSATLWLVVARRISSWDLHTPVGLVVFGVLLVATSLFLSFRVDLFTLPRREKVGRRQFLNRADAWSRLVKFILGGVVIPIAALVAANRIELPNHRTPMAVVIEAGRTGPAISGAERLGNAVVNVASPAAKVEGILALQAMGSSDALDQLFRILAHDPAVWSDGSEYRTLVKALAASGAQAKQRLLDLIRGVPAAERRSASSPPGTLFERFFSRAFESANGEIESRSRDAASRAPETARLQAAEAELQRALSQIEVDTTASRAAGLPGFVMQVLLAMAAPQDGELLAFARGTAGDVAWSDAVRGQALLLVAKLGGEDDLDGIYPYLESPSPVLQAYAIRAVAELQSKVSSAVAK